MQDKSIKTIQEIKFSLEKEFEKNTKNKKEDFEKKLDIEESLSEDVSKSDISKRLKDVVNKGFTEKDKKEISYQKGTFPHRTYSNSGSLTKIGDVKKHVEDIKDSASLNRAKTKNALETPLRKRTENQQKLVNKNFNEEVIDEKALVQPKDEKTVMTEFENQMKSLKEISDKIKERRREKLNNIKEESGPVKIYLDKSLANRQPIKITNSSNAVERDEDKDIAKKHLHKIGLSKQMAKKEVSKMNSNELQKYKHANEDLENSNLAHIILGNKAEKIKAEGSVERAKAKKLLKDKENTMNSNKVNEAIEGLCSLIEDFKDVINHKQGEKFPAHKKGKDSDHYQKGDTQLGEIHPKNSKADIADRKEQVKDSKEARKSGSREVYHTTQGEEGDLGSGDVGYRDKDVAGAKRRYKERVIKSAHAKNKVNEAIEEIINIVNEESKGSQRRLNNLKDAYSRKSNAAVRAAVRQYFKGINTKITETVDDLINSGLIDESVKQEIHDKKVYKNRPSVTVVNSPDDIKRGRKKWSNYSKKHAGAITRYTQKVVDNMDATHKFKNKVHESIKDITSFLEESVVALFDKDAKFHNKGNVSDAVKGFMIKSATRRGSSQKEKKDYIRKQGITETFQEIINLFEDENYNNHKKVADTLSTKDALWVRKGVNRELGSYQKDKKVLKKKGLSLSKMNKTFDGGDYEKRVKSLRTMRKVLNDKLSESFQEIITMFEDEHRDRLLKAGFVEADRGDMQRAIDNVKKTHQESDRSVSKTKTREQASKEVKSKLDAYAARKNKMHESVEEIISLFENVSDKDEALKEEKNKHEIARESILKKLANDKKGRKDAKKHGVKVERTLDGAKHIRADRARVNYINSILTETLEEILLSFQTEEKSIEQETLSDKDKALKDKLEEIKAGKAKIEELEGLLKEENGLGE